MKKLFSKKSHPAEIGAGIGLMLVCTATIVLDQTMIPFGIFFNVFSFLIAMGIFSANREKDKCKKKGYGK